MLGRAEDVTGLQQRLLNSVCLPLINSATEKYVHIFQISDKDVLLTTLGQMKPETPLHAGVYNIAFRQPACYCVLGHQIMKGTIL